MKTISLYVVSALLLCGCTKKDPGASQREAVQRIEKEMAQFAASNNAKPLDAVTANWKWNSLTADMEAELTKDAKPVVAELVFPDVRRDQSNNLVLEGTVSLPIPWQGRIEALISTNLLPQVRESRSNLAGLWLVLKVEAVQRRPIANDNEEIVLRGRAETAESRPPGEWATRIARPAAK